MAEWTYEIDEKEKRVYRIAPDGERRFSFSLPFHVMDLKSLQRLIGDRNNMQICLIARDELIDRGLIPDE